MASPQRFEERPRHQPKSATARTGTPNCRGRGRNQWNGIFPAVLASAQQDPQFLEKFWRSCVQHYTHPWALGPGPPGGAIDTGWNLTAAPLSS